MRAALQDVAWSFVGEPFADRAAFEAELKQAQSSPATFEPGEIAILSPSIRVAYMCWEGDEQLHPVVSLTAQNGLAFTTGDLMFQLHDAVVELLREIDHHFFEGLAFVEAGPPPLYRMRQGS